MTRSPLDIVERTDMALHMALDPAHRATLIATTDVMARADAARARRRYLENTRIGPVDGDLVVWKDVFDVAGSRTTAGSASRARLAPAMRSAAIVERARRAGLVTIGKANMSELAFSGLGVNRTFGTPVNPTDTHGVPGGSSSGSVVAVATGLVPMAVGTDTSGSIRVPAAFCGVVGHRSSRGRHGPPGFLPLAPTLDCIGLTARTVADVRRLDSALRVDGSTSPVVSPIRFVVPSDIVERSTPAVRMQFEQAVEACRRHGIAVDREDVPALQLSEDLMDQHGTIVGAEAWERHQGLLANSADVEAATLRRLRQNAGNDVTPVRSAMHDVRESFVRQLAGRLLMCPTVSHPPPRLSELTDPATYDRANAACLRTTMVLSYVGTCGTSLPLLDRSTGAVSGLLLSAPDGHDDRLLAAAAQVESMVNDHDCVGVVGAPE